MAKRKRIKRQTITDKTLPRKLKIERHKLLLEIRDELWYSGRVGVPAPLVMPFMLLLDDMNFV